MRKENLKPLMHQPTIVLHIDRYQLVQIHPDAAC